MEEEDNLNVRKSTQENIIIPRGGGTGLLITFVLLILTVVSIVIAAAIEIFPLIALGVVCFILFFINNFGFFTIEPNEAFVLTYYGKYVGTVKENGFFWINPFTSKTRISLKSKNLNGAQIKVSDKDGNPIEIAVVVVWKIKDTAKATFDVENYVEYITVNSESAIRHVASSYPYDKHGDDEPSLRGQHPDVMKTLITELEDKTKDAGISIEDAKITHLAYSPEISNAMLKRQQAEATIQARQKIIQGACGIVRDSINSLTNMDIKMTDDQKAHLVTNLLVVMCSESQVNPVVNTGSV